MQILDVKAVRQALPYPALVTALAEAFRAGGQVPERMHFNIPRTGGQDMTMIFMPAWSSSGNVGVKLVTVAPDNRARDLPSICATYLLLDGETGRPLLMIDGTELTARRTAAVSALAAQHLAPPSSRTHLIMGAGAVAACVARSHRILGTIDRTMVWARNGVRAAALCAELNSEGLCAEAVDDLERAISESDIISTATLASEPILFGRHLKEEVHLDLIGAYLPHMREADDAALQGAIIYADNPEGALKESGEIAIPLAANIIPAAALVGGLTDILQQPHWQRPRGKTIFKSVGTAISDFAAAQCALKWFDVRHP